MIKSKAGTNLEALHPLNSFGSERLRPSPKLTVLSLSESELRRKLFFDKWRLPRKETPDFLKGHKFVLLSFTVKES